MLVRHREILTEQNPEGHSTHCPYLPLKQHELLGVTQIQAYLDGGICYYAKLSHPSPGSCALKQLWLNHALRSS